MDNIKIWDMTFKTLLIEAPKLFLPLIKEVFGVEYSKDSKLVLLNNEFYDKDDKKVIADTSFSIGGKRYHFECQFSNDKEMVLRMFEYDFHIAVSGLRSDGEYMELNFPRSCVVYISLNQNNPKKLQMKLNFQQGISVMYEVPTIRVQDYDIMEIEEKDLELFIPFLILRYRNRWDKKELPTVGELKGFYFDIIVALNKAYADHRLTETEYITVREALQKTTAYELKGHKDIMEGVGHIMTELLELPGLEALKSAVKETERKTTIELIVDMYENGVDVNHIIELAQERGISKEELSEVINLKQHSQEQLSQ